MPWVESCCFCASEAGHSYAPLVLETSLGHPWLPGLLTSATAHKIYELWLRLNTGCHSGRSSAQCLKQGTNKSSLVGSHMPGNSHVSYSLAAGLRKTLGLSSMVVGILAKWPHIPCFLCLQLPSLTLFCSRIFYQAYLLLAPSVSAVRPFPVFLRNAGFRASAQGSPSPWKALLNI